MLSFPRMCPVCYLIPSMIDQGDRTVVLVIR